MGDILCCYCVFWLDRSIESADGRCVLSKLLPEPDQLFCVGENDNMSVETQSARRRCVSMCIGSK